MTRRPNSRDPLGTDAEGRPVRRALTREYIVRTALALLDRDGIEGLSMRKLGAELGVNPMAFYHHLPNKSALFDGVVEAIFAEVAAGLDTLERHDNWRDRIAALMRLFRAVLLRHPNVLMVMATRPSYAPELLAFGDRTIGMLHDSGLTEHERLIVISSLRSYTLGQLLVQIGQPVGGPATGPAEGATLLAEYPHLAKAVAGGYDPDAQYELTLQAMLDGFERRLGK